MRFSIRSQGVIRSEREMMQRSCPIGAPRSEAAFWNALIPGTTSISTCGASFIVRISYINGAIP